MSTPKPVAPAIEVVDLRGRLPTRTGARPYYTRPLDGIVGVVLHYSASSAWLTPEQIAAYQTGPAAHEQFPGVAYHVIIDGAGRINLCHGLDARTWHCGAVVDGIARNLTHIGVCYTGSMAPNAEQVEGLGAAVAWCERELGRRLSVEGHRDVDLTLCPGPSWPSWRGSVLAAIDRYR